MSFDRTIEERWKGSNPLQSPFYFKWCITNISSCCTTYLYLFILSSDDLYFIFPFMTDDFTCQLADKKKILHPKPLHLCILIHRCLLLIRDPATRLPVQGVSNPYAAPNGLCHFLRDLRPASIYSVPEYTFPREKDVGGISVGDLLWAAYPPVPHSRSC